MIEQILVGLIGLISAIVAIRSKKIIHCIVGLAIFLLCVACLFYYLGAIFLAIGQIIVFVGGFISLLLLNFSDTSEDHTTSRANILKLGLIGIFLCFVLILVPMVSGSEQIVDLKDVASSLFSNYWILINLAFIILLSAVVTSTYILRKER